MADEETSRRGRGDREPDETLDRLEAELQRTKAFADACSEGIVIYDGERVLAVNEAMGRLVGSSPELLTGTAFDGIIDLRPGVESEQISSSMLPGSPEAVVRRTDGATIPVEVAHRAVTYDGVERRAIAVRDIRERKQALRALRESEQRYRVLLDTCPDGITVTDLEGRVLMSNQQAAAIEGYDDPAEAMRCASDAFARIAPEDRERAFRNAELALETGKISRIEYSVLRKDGGRVPVELNVSLLTDDDGAPSGFIGVIRDVTERKQAEAERARLQARLQDAQKLESLGLLAGGIAHDFNNLLVGMLGGASLALHELGPDHPACSHVAQVETAALHGRELTGQLLTYAGKACLDWQPIDMSILVEEMVGLAALSVSKRAAVVTDLANGLPTVEADPTQIRQVVMNLLTNAAESLPDAGGTISLRTRVAVLDDDALAGLDGGAELEPGRYVVLDVADTGCGMGESVSRRLFDPFFSTKLTGRGLGMSVVFGIVRSHGGAISVDTKAGAGTTIAVWLPASDRSAVVSAAEQVDDGVAKAPTGAGSVLVVDDERAVRDVVKSILDAAGIDAVAVDSGPRAVERLRDEPDRFAAVLLDATMPAMDGAETSRALRRINPQVRILFSSGFAEHDLADGLRLEPGDGFIQKPYRMAEFLAALDEVLKV